MISLFFVFRLFCSGFLLPLLERNKLLHDSSGWLRPACLPDFVKSCGPQPAVGRPSAAHSANVIMTLENQQRSDARSTNILMRTQSFFCFSRSLAYYASYIGLVSLVLVLVSSCSDVCRLIGECLKDRSPFRELQNGTSFREQIVYILQVIVR